MRVGLRKNAFCEENGVEIFEFGFDIVEQKPVSTSIGVINRGIEACRARWTGNQDGANGVGRATFGDHPDLPESESFFVVAFGATEQDMGTSFKEA